jgi:hypothetical protein
LQNVEGHNQPKGFGLRNLFASTWRAREEYGFYDGKNLLRIRLVKSGSQGWLDVALPLHATRSSGLYSARPCPFLMEAPSSCAGPARGATQQRAVRRAASLQPDGEVSQDAIASQVTQVYHRRCYCAFLRFEERSSVPEL